MVLHISAYLYRFLHHGNVEYEKKPISALLLCYLIATTRDGTHVMRISFITQFKCIYYVESK